MFCTGRFRQWRPALRSLLFALPALLLVACFSAAPPTSDAVDEAVRRLRVCRDAVKELGESPQLVLDRTKPARIERIGDVYSLTFVLQDTERPDVQVRVVMGTTGSRPWIVGEAVVVRSAGTKPLGGDCVYHPEKHGYGP